MERNNYLEFDAYLFHSLAQYTNITMALGPWVLFLLESLLRCIFWPLNNIR